MNFDFDRFEILGIIYLFTYVLTTGIIEFHREESTRVRTDSNHQQRPAVKIIFDTDFHTDCDDAGALAVLHALADRGECEILAIMCSTRDPFSAPAIDVINTYYGRPD